VGAVTISDAIVPTVRAAVPVRTLGHVAGALVAELDLDAIWDLVDRIHVGRTGHALLIDANGRIIAHGDPRGKALIPRHESLSAILAMASGAAANGGIAEGRGSLGTEVVAVIVPVPHTTWRLILEQDVSEAFGKSRRLAWLLVGLALSAVLLALVIGTRLARRSMLVPLRRLEEAAEAFARRRFDHRVELHTGDELERFGQTLNDMASALARAYEDLARTERAQAFGMVAAGLAHDLKHPVGDLVAVLMRARGKEGAEIDRAVAESARRAVPRLKEMVEQLRDLGRAGRRRDSELPAAALLEALDGFQARAEEKGVTLEGRAPAARVMVLADGMLLSRAIENLVSNALEATPTGGRVTVTIDAPPSGALEIRVRDTGPGIAGEDAAELSRPFVSADADKGLGLGLHVVSRVVEAHGGALRVGRPAEGGSELVMILPVITGATRVDRPLGAALPEAPAGDGSHHRTQSPPAPLADGDG
jgi:signal transduction histidine kinase